MTRILPATALAWLFLSTAATAETGLERFEREIRPQIELQTFTYKSAETLGDKGFVLNQVVVAGCHEVDVWDATGHRVAARTGMQAIGAGLGEDQQVDMPADPPSPTTIDVLVAHRGTVVMAP